MKSTRTRTHNKNFMNQNATLSLHLNFAVYKKHRNIIKFLRYSRYPYFCKTTGRWYPTLVCLFENKIGKRTHDTLLVTATCEQKILVTTKTTEYAKKTFSHPVYWTKTNCYLRRKIYDSIPAFLLFHQSKANRL